MGDKDDININELAEYSEGEDEAVNETANTEATGGATAGKQGEAKKMRQPCS